MYIHFTGLELKTVEATLVSSKCLPPACQMGMMVDLLRRLEGDHPFDHSIALMVIQDLDQAGAEAGIFWQAFENLNIPTTVSILAMLARRISPSPKATYRKTECVTIFFRSSVQTLDVKRLNDSCASSLLDSTITS